MFYLNDSLTIYHQIVTYLIKQIKLKPDLSIMFATGNTMIPFYQLFVQYAKKDKLDCSRIITFNLDEYILHPNSPIESFRTFMNKHLFNHLNFNHKKIHFLPSFAEDINVEICIEQYEELIERYGLDEVFLGLGLNNHIAFNEPGSTKESKTRIIYLSESTIEANHLINVYSAFTVGIKTILKGKNVHLIVTGKRKSEAIKRHFLFKPTIDYPSTFLKRREINYWIDIEAIQSYFQYKSIDDTIHKSEFLDEQDIFYIKKILIFAPHPDDDVMGMGGAIRKFHNYGCEITINKYDLLIGLNKEELHKKKKSILCHQSQLDPYYTRYKEEFWEIILERNKKDAQYILKKEIVGIEGFKLIKNNL